MFKYVHRAFNKICKGSNVTSALNQDTIHTGPDIQAFQMEGCLTLSNRYEVLKYIPKNGVVGEIGVKYGAFSRTLVNELKPIKFYALDLFSIKPGDPEFWGLNEFKKTNKNHYEYYRDVFGKEIEQGLVEMKKGVSYETLLDFEDDYFDYIYFDNAHDYESVRKNIQILQRKVKDSGIIQFNNYILWSYFESMPYGVVQAVNEFLFDSPHRIKYFCLHPHGYNNVAVQLNKNDNAAIHNEKIKIFEHYQAKTQKNVKTIDADSEKQLYELIKTVMYKYDEDTQFSEDELIFVQNCHFDMTMQYVRDRIIPWVESFCPLNNAKVLDVGCGTGTFTLALTEQGALVTAMDIDDAPMTVAKERLRLHGLEADFINLNVNQLSNLKENFDLIVFSRSMEHFTHEERLKGIKSAYDLLKENGCLALYQTPNRLWFDDTHTSWTPFFNWLSDKAAIDYAQYTKRAEGDKHFQWAFNGDSIQNGIYDIERLARWGRGVSFHDFEIALNQVGKLTLAGPCLQRFFEQPIHEFSKMLKTIGPEYVDEGFYEEYLELAIKKV